MLPDHFQYADIRFLNGQLKGKPVLSEDRGGRSLLRTAIENLRLDYVEPLLLYGADPCRVLWVKMGSIFLRRFITRERASAFY